jgi:DNA-binding CsgD family transcriptional regulator
VWHDEREQTAMARMSNETGLNILGDLIWGTHFCLFHETTQDLLDILVPYFKTGLINKEFCLWVLSESITNAEALEALRVSIPDIDRHLLDGGFELVSHGEWFFESGQFDLQRIVDRFRDKCHQALSMGYAGMRVDGSSAWLLMKDGRRFIEFETELEQLVANERMIVLCSFPLREIAADEVLTAARTHQFSLARRKGVWEIIEAPKVPTRIGSLTPREQQVLTWVARGKSAWEIGEILHIAKRTIDEHVQKAVRKLDAINRTQAVVIALRDRLIDIDEE